MLPSDCSLIKIVFLPSKKKPVFRRSGSCPYGSEKTRVSLVISETAIPSIGPLLMSHAVAGLSQRGKTESKMLSLLTTLWQRLSRLLNRLGNIFAGSGSPGTDSAQENTTAAQAAIFGAAQISMQAANTPLMGSGLAEHGTSNSDASQSQGQSSDLMTTLPPESSPSGPNQQ